MQQPTCNTLAVQVFGAASVLSWSPASASRSIHKPKTLLAVQVVEGGIVFFRESCFRQSGDKARKNNPTHYRCACCCAVLCCAVLTVGTLPVERLLNARARHAGHPACGSPTPEPVGWHALPLLTLVWLHLPASFVLQQPEGVLPNLRQRARSAGEWLRRAPQLVSPACLLQLLQDRQPMQLLPSPRHTFVLHPDACF